MAAITTVWLWPFGIGLIFLFTINYALSGQQSGILSKLYKKAALANRPMILVIDNSPNSNVGKSQEHDYYAKGLLNFVPKQIQSLTGVKKQQALASHVDRDVQNNWPYNLNKYVGHRYHHNRGHQDKVKVHHHGVTRSLRSRNRNKQLQLNRDDRNYRDSGSDRDYWDNSENSDRRGRYQDNRDRHDRNRNHQDRRDRDIDDQNKRDRKRNDQDRRERFDRNKANKDRDDRDRRDRDRHDQVRFDQNRDEQDRRERFHTDKRHKHRDDRDRRDRDRDYRDRRDRDRDYWDRHDRDWDDREMINNYRNDRDRRDRDRRDPDRYNQKRNDYDRNLDRTLRLLVDSNLAKQDPQTKLKYAQKDNMLQPSVIKNLLRITNDLNCEAQGECLDKCENNKNQDKCENKCETKFECDDIYEKSDRSPETVCDYSDGCDEEDDKNPSTRGMAFEYAPSLCPGC